MSNLTEIGKGYIAEAREIVSNSWKYFTAFFLIITACWLFSEEVFWKTKYQDIRLNQLYEQINSVKKQAGSNPEQKLLDSLYQVQKTEEATNSELYQSVEENVPGGFKIILRQATRKPFGLIILSLTVLSFLWYGYRLRISYLRKICVGLRIIKEAEGYNAISDYNFDMPFWVHPIPAFSNKSVLRPDLLRIGGHRYSHRNNNILIGTLLIAALLLQFRLFYFSLVSNYAILHWGLLLQALTLIASIAIVLLWLLPAPIPIQYKSEDAKSNLSRKTFLTLGTLTVAGILLGWQGKPLGRRLAQSQLRPRYVMHKRKRQQSPVYVLEQEALPCIKEGKIMEAADILFKKLKTVEQYRYENHVRNFSLLIYLCRRDQKVHKKYFNATIKLLKSGGQEQLILLANSWQKAHPKKIRKQRAKKAWDIIKG